MSASPPPPEPFRIEPIFSERIWGSRSLAPIFPEKTNLNPAVGEAWLTGVDCPVATGPFTGKTLGDAWREMPAAWRGAQCAVPGDFPLLLKFIFPTDKLSIQVHPDDAYASVHEKAAGGRGKTEMWHIVSAEPGATLLAGLKPGVSKAQFTAALANHTLEELFVRHPVQAGNTFFIPAGTPHTIGPGMVVFEVQEYSDLTYRVYDYGRVDVQGKPRELHVEKALRVMNFSDAPKLLIRSHPQRVANATVSVLAGCRYFAAERCEFSAPWTSAADSKWFQLFVVLSGTGTVRWPASTANYRRGECWLVPAGLGDCAFLPSGPTVLLQAYMPDIDVLRDDLRRRGIPETAIAAAVLD